MLVTTVIVLLQSWCVLALSSKYPHVIVSLVGAHGLTRFLLPTRISYRSRDGSEKEPLRITVTTVLLPPAASRYHLLERARVWAGVDNIRGRESDRERTIQSPAAALCAAPRKNERKEKDNSTFGTRLCGSKETCFLHWTSGNLPYPVLGPNEITLNLIRHRRHEDVSLIYKGRQGFLMNVSMH